MHKAVIVSLIFILFGMGCAHKPATIIRHSINSWESEIGYSAVVQTGNTYHISGVTCGGPDYQSAVSVCYKELESILNRYQLKPHNIVKENVYAMDIEALKQQIPARKNFYGNEKFPSATWVQVSRLYSSDHLIEIELTAVK